MTTTATASVAPSMKRSRLLLIGYFATLGVVMAVWGARMPAVRAAADLQSGGLAVVLLSAAAGMVGGLLIGGRIAHRFGSSRLLVVPAVGFGFSLVLLGQGCSLLTLSLAAAVFGSTDCSMSEPTPPQSRANGRTAVRSCPGSIAPTAPARSSEPR